MINVMRAADFYEFLDSQSSRAKFTKSSDEVWKRMLYAQQRDFDQNVLVWIWKNSAFVDRIANMCDFNIQQLLDSVWTAKKTWEYLKKRYLSQNWFHKWFVFNRLKQIHYSNCKSATKYEVAYKNILKKIIDLSITMKNAVVIKMFNNFDLIFETFLTVKNNEAKKNNDFFDIDKFIIVVEQKKNRVSLISLNLTRVGDDRNNNNNNNRDDRSSRDDREDERDTDSNNDFTRFLCKKCYIIHQLDNEHCSNKDEICDNSDCENSRNHKSINCIWFEEARYSEWIVEQRRKNTTTTSFDFITLFTSKVHIEIVQISINKMISNRFSFSIWILDFGVTHHCSDNRELFSEQLKRINDIANTANDETLNVENLDNIIIIFFSKKTLTFIDVMYIFDFIVNLISTSKLYHRQWIITYFVDKSVELHKDGDLIVQIDLINDLFVLRTAQNSINTIFSVTKVVIFAILVSEAYVFAFIKSTIDLKTWHRRLVHSEYRNVIVNSSKIIDMEKVKDSVSNALCELCMFDRQQIEIFKVFIWKFAEFAIKISVDIGDSLSTTMRNNRIFIFIKCYDIDMMFWFARKHKFEIYKCVIDFVIWIKRQTKCDVRIIVADDEFDFIVFDNYFKKIDIQWKLSVSDTFQQNGYIERVMYIVMNFVRFVLKDMRLPKDFWNFIDENVVYVKNRIITTSDDNNKIITSFETVNEKILNVFNFRALNCRAYTHVLKIIKRHKLDDRSWKGIFVNYANNNQWKIYNSRTRKIHIIRNVRFDENYSYYDQDHRAFSDLHEHNDELEVNEFWHSKDDVWFDFRFGRSFDSSERVSFSEKTFSERVALAFVQISMTSEFLSSRDDDSNADESDAENAEFEEKEFVEVSKNHDYSNDSNSTSIDEFQNSSLSDDSISGISTFFF